MTDEELIARLRQDDTDFWHCEAADRIEALVRQVKDEQAAKFKMRDERDAAKIAASNYADFNHTWRKRAERLEAVLRELIDHTHNCEKELTERLYRADFCGESLPLTNARAALK